MCYECEQRFVSNVSQKGVADARHEETTAVHTNCCCALALTPSHDRQLLLVAASHQSHASFVAMVQRFKLLQQLQQRAVGSHQ